MAKQKMNVKRYTKAEIISMTTEDFKVFQIAIASRAFRLLGMQWKEWIRWYEDPLMEELVFEWV